MRQKPFKTRRMMGILLSANLLLSPIASAQVTLGDTPQNGPIMAPSATSALQVQSSTHKVPAGSFLTIAFNTAMDSRVSNMGDPFNAFIAEDFKVNSSQDGRPGSRIVLPAGTIVRGRINDVKRPSLFSRGGSIFLSFDHVVLPSGEQLPLTLNLSTENTSVNKQGALYMDPGIGKKVEKGYEEGKKAFGTITDNGFQAGKQIAGGFGSILTVPAAVIGGALVGTGITTGKAAAAVVGKGDSAIIKPGDTMTIDFGGSFNIPSE